MQTSKVVIVQDSTVFQGDSVDPAAVFRMIRTGMTTLLGTPDAEAAWKSLFQLDDIVGLKVNCLAGRGLSTRPEVAYGIAEGLRAVPRVIVSNIIAIVSGMRALTAYFGTLRGAPVVWDKTEHSDHPAMALHSELPE